MFKALIMINEVTERPPAVARSTTESKQVLKIEVTADSLGGLLAKIQRHLTVAEGEGI